MATIFLMLIYLAFISLGLPDSVLGASWPAMRQSLGLPLSGAGIVSIIITCGTILSSLMAGRLLSRFGTGKTTVISVFLTAGALCGICFAPSFIWLCVLAVPLGLGAGSVDAGLNNFVALHYKASHMSWLHCFWGVGATIGPFIMAGALKTSTWNQGYLSIGIIQAIVAVLLLFSLPLWKKHEPYKPSFNMSSTHGGVKVTKLRGVWLVLFSFFMYCAMETTAGLWGATFLAESKGLNPQAAAQFGAAFYFGITIGRLVCGFIAIKVSARLLILIGGAVCTLSAAALMLPFLSAEACGILLVMLGLGCAPIYPSIIHETPRRFGEENSAPLIGLQMACAYSGIMIVTPLTGVMASSIGIWVYPVVLTVCSAIMLLLCIKADRMFINNRRVSSNEQ